MNSYDEMMSALKIASHKIDEETKVRTAENLKKGLTSNGEEIWVVLQVESSDRRYMWTLKKFKKVLDAIEI